MRRWTAVVLVSLLTACTTDGSTTTTPSPSTTTQSPTTTTAPATTTTPPATTVTSPPPTTTTTKAVTVDDNLPSALPRADVPWDQVGDGWYVVLYDASGSSPGPVVLYLVDSRGNRYELISWPADARPWSLTDAADSFALVTTKSGGPDRTEYGIVDLASGSIVGSHSTEPGPPSGPWPETSLTRPSGANLVVWQSDGVDEWLERRSPSGTTLAEVFRQPYTDEQNTLGWMYGYDGTFLLVTHQNGIALVSITGTDQEALWVPADTVCEPARWWDEDTYLAACYGQSLGSAPADEYGQPAIFYGRLWLLETDGSAGVPLTEYPEDPPIVVDFGYSDAWPTGSGTFIQWTGDCGAAQVAALQPDGRGVFVPITGEFTHFVDGVRMIDIVGGRIAVYGWEGCDAWIGSLFVTNLDGNHLNDLVPRVGDARGVIGVEGLTTLYP